MKEQILLLNMLFVPFKSHVGFQSYRQFYFASLCHKQLKKENKNKNKSITKTKTKNNDKIKKKERKKIERHNFLCFLLFFSKLYLTLLTLKFQGDSMHSWVK